MKRKNEPLLSEMDKKKLIGVVAEALGIPEGESMKAYESELKQIGEYLVLKAKDGHFKETIPDTKEAVKKEIDKALKLNGLTETSRTPVKVDVIKAYFNFKRTTDDIMSDYEKHVQEFKKKPQEESDLPPTVIG